MAKYQFDNSIFEPDGDYHPPKSTRDKFGEWAETALNGKPAPEPAADPNAPKRTRDQFAEWMEDSLNPKDVDPEEKALADFNRAAEDVKRAYSDLLEARSAKQAAEAKENRPPELPAGAIPDGGHPQNMYFPRDPKEAFSDFVYDQLAYDPFMMPGGWKDISHLER